jgi:hypothetical protein
VILSESSVLPESRNEEDQRDQDAADDGGASGERVHRVGPKTFSIAIARIPM